VAIFGKIFREDPSDPVNPDPTHVNYHTYYGRTYNDFTCLNNNDSSPDGDIGSRRVPALDARMVGVA
jgi:hypothetical protein